MTHRRYLKEIPALAERPVQIALDEWNYWYGPHLYGELGTRYFLKDALGIARGLHEMFRQHDVIQMANYAQTVNVIGCIKTTKTAAAFDTTGLPLVLYRHHFGSMALALEGDPAPLDVAAALTSDGSKVTIAIVNPTLAPTTLHLDITGGKLASGATRYLITGQDPGTYNEPGKAPAVAIAEEPVNDWNPAAIAVPAISVSLFVVEVARE